MSYSENLNRRMRDKQNGIVQKKIAFLFQIVDDPGNLRIDSTLEDVDEISKENSNLTLEELCQAVAGGMNKNLQFNIHYAQKLASLCLAYVGRTESWKMMKLFQQTGMLISITFQKNGSFILRPGTLMQYEDIEEMKSINDGTGLFPPKDNN